MKQRIHDNKKYLAIFYDRCDTLTSQYTDAEIGKIIRAAIQYELYGERTELDDRALNVMLCTLFTDSDIMTEKANDRSKKNKYAADTRWKKDKATEQSEEEMDEEIRRDFPPSWFADINANACK